MSAAAGVMVGKRLGRKEYDEAYTESKKVMYAGLAGAVAVSTLLILLAGVYTGLYRVDDSVKAHCVCLQRMYLSGASLVCIHCSPRKKYSGWLYRLLFLRGASG